MPDASLSGFAFTGEQRDTTGLQYHRARYYAPNLGIFPSLDPFEGMSDRPMSLNGYSWVEGNVVNATDASGRCLPLIIGAVVIGGITGAAYDTFVTQGYGFGGRNDIRNPNRDNQDIGQTAFSALAGSGLGLGTLVIVKGGAAAWVGAGTNVAGSHISGNYEGLSADMVIVRLSTDITIGGTFGRLWAGGVGSIQPTGWLALGGRGLVAGTVNAGQGITSRITNVVLFGSDETILDPSVVTTDFGWGFGTSGFFDLVSFVKTGGGWTPRAKPSGSVITRPFARNRYGVFFPNPTYVIQNIYNHQNLPFWQFASAMGGTNILPPVSGQISDIISPILGDSSTSAHGLVTIAQATDTIPIYIMVCEDDSTEFGLIQDPYGAVILLSESCNIGNMFNEP